MNRFVHFFFVSIMLIAGFVYTTQPLLALDTGITSDGIAGQAASGAGYGATDQFTLAKIVGTVVQFAFGFFGILFTLLTVYAGFNWMTAQGDTGKVETAQNTIQQAIIGMVICFSGYGISNFVLNAFFGR